MNINDRELLARTLQAEAGNQGYDGMLAAGSVIMNRANATGYGDGMRGVILKPGQFSAWNSRKGPDGNPIYADGEQGQDMAAMRASDGAYKAADALIAGTYEDSTGGATHYYNPEYSQPKWGQKAGGDWKRIGDHVFGFADAGKKPNPNQAIAADTMKALGSLPNAVGLLGSAQAANNTESKMIPEEKPRGLLGSLGIQKMEEGAEGEAGQRFFQRDTFKDTAANLAQGFAAMGSSPALQKMTADVASQRTESKAKNKTIEYLRTNGRGDLADAVESGSLGIRDAAVIMFEKPKALGYETKTITMADGSEVMVEREKGTNNPWQPSQLPEGGTAGGGGNVKLTEAQGKLTLFKTLQTETQPVLLALEKQFDPANLSDPTMARIPIAGNYFASPEYQMYTTAAAAWAEGALRIATGAAAQQSEIERNIKTYFAQPGDTPQTVAFKSQMREMYNRAVNGALGQAPTGDSLPVPTPEEFMKEADGPNGGEFPNAPPIGTINKGFSFKGGNPEDRNNWEKI